MLWKSLYFSTFLIATVYGATTRKLTSEDESIQKYSIQMIGYSPQKTDDYVAVVREAIPGYIVGFEPLANADRVHHILLYGCTTPAENSGFWRGHATCGYPGGSHILYAWARNAPNLVLPKNVGFSVGHEDDGIKYFVMQVHYASPFQGEVHDFSGITLHISQQRPVNLAAVLLFVSGTPIPPKMPQFQNNISCDFTSDTPIHPFAYRVHTHQMGRVVSAFYRSDSSQWTKIGKRNPQWPQLFEPIQNQLTISKGYHMAASCRFDSSDKNRTVRMGEMGVDEMCNFYMMYYFDASKPNPFPQGGYCGGDNVDVMSTYPQDGFTLLPPKPELEHHAHQSSVPFGVVLEGRHTSIGGVKLGQVAGLAFDKKTKNLFVFHRAGRVWDGRTFDNYNILLDKSPINDDVILEVAFNGNQTTVVRKMGRGKFFLPHGIYIDDEGFVYTTDVGSHTVAKWRIEGDDLVQVWESGKKLEPGPDDEHFCKPTGITKIGTRIFVTDGYCNSRVAELDISGKRVKNFGLPGYEDGQFDIPHDVVVDAHGRLIVSDRENGRVQELSKDGAMLSQIKSTMFSTIYSADVYEDYVFMVPGRQVPGHESEGLSVFVARSGTGLVEFAFSPPSRGARETAGPQFGQPHALRVCPTGDHVFVGDIAPGGTPTLWQFRIQHENSHQTMGSIGGQSERHYTNTVLALLAACVLGFGLITIRKKWNLSQNGGGFDKKGFKPLRTEETVNFIADESDSD